MTSSSRLGPPVCGSILRSPVAACLSPANRQAIWRALFLVALAIAPAFAPATWAATINAATCSSTDVQAAINPAAGGDTVVIPNGACTWTSGVTINGKGIVLTGQSKTGVAITNNASYGITVTETQPATPRSRR